MIYVFHIVVLIMTFGTVELIDYDNTQLDTVAYENFTYREIFANGYDSTMFDVEPTSQELNDLEQDYNQLVNGTYDRTYTENQLTYAHLLLSFGFYWLWVAFFKYVPPKLRKSLFTKKTPA